MKLSESIVRFFSGRITAGYPCMYVLSGRWRLCVFFLFVVNAAIAQTRIEYVGTDDEGVIYATAFAEAPEFIPTSDGGLIASLKEGNPMLVAGCPDLYHLSASFIVDDYHEMNITVLRAEYRDYPDIDISPSRGNLSRLVDPGSIPLERAECYTQDEFFPGNLAALDPAFIQGAFRGQTVQFYPLQYNPVSRVLRIYSKIEIALEPFSQPGFNALPQSGGRRISLPMREHYLGHFLNFGAVSERYEPLDELGRLLIIAPELYESALAPFIAWKKQKGIPTEYVKADNLSNLNELKSLVLDRYTSEEGLTYLLVIGDEHQVPVDLVTNANGTGYCDACYGYLMGDDHYSEIFVGHLVVHNASELTPLVSKIMEYEKNPDTSVDWFSVALGMASNEGNGIGDENQIDWEHANGIKSDLLGYSYTQVWELYDGNHTASSPTGGITADGMGNPTPTQVSTRINTGCSLINYTGHGGHSNLVTGAYTNMQIEQLTNAGRYPYFIAVGCGVGDYDDDAGNGDTFGEVWIKSSLNGQPTGGIGGAFSTVFQSWAPPMEGQDEMNRLIAELVPYSTRHTLGSIHFHGLASMNDAYGPPGHDMSDTWTLMSDPTVQLRTALPVQVLAVHDAALVFGSNSLWVGSGSEGAMACLSRDNEILATAVIENGSCNLSFLPLEGEATCLLTLTHFNSIPYQQEIPVIPPDGPYLIVTDHLVNDAGGNNNGLPDFGENVGIDIGVRNIGNEIAGQVEITLQTGDSYVTILDGSWEINTLGAGESLLSSSAFSIAIQDDVPDQHVAHFVVHAINESGEQWSGGFSLILNAPLLVCSGNWEWAEINGNGNGKMESGERVQWRIPFDNAGHAATTAVLIPGIELNSPYFEIISAEFESMPLLPGAQGEVVVVFDIATAPYGESADAHVSVSSGAYTADCDFTAWINLVTEDWESGNLTSYDWQLEGDASWYISDMNPYDGEFCLQSGDIGNSQSTSLALAIVVPEAGNLRFAVRTSCEPGFDYLRFRLDGATVAYWTGEQDWTEYSVPLESGSHLLRWIYEKDAIISVGHDAAWLDQIVFPPSVAVHVVESSDLHSSVYLFPNPSVEQAIIGCTLEQAGPLEISVLDVSGHEIRRLHSAHLPQGAHHIPLSRGLMGSGIYLIRVVAGDQISTLRWIIQD